MTSQKERPKGTRDFFIEVMLKRNYVFKRATNCFSMICFMPIETLREFRYLKYGEEGD